MNEQELIRFSVELINRNIEKILGSLKGYGSEKIKQHQVKTGKAFKDYLESAIIKYSKVKTVIYGATPVFLYSTYTELNLKDSYDNIITASNVSNLLKFDNNLIISGIAGSGKSTLLKYLFLNSIENGNHIPIFIELRDINNTELSFIEFIYTSLEKLNFNLKKEDLVTALESGNLIFFLDGLDEVSYIIRDKIEKGIIELSSKYNKNFFLISSRPNENFIGWNTYTELEVLPLSKQQAMNLVDQIDYFPLETRNRFLDELKSILYEEHYSFASNPLLLTIMYLSFSFNANISRKINGFYEDAFEALYRRHDASKLGFRRKKYLDLDIRDFKSVLSCFSLLSYFRGYYEFSSSQLIKFIDESKEITQQLEINSEKFFLDMYNSINILIRDGQKYVFSHRTFQEYFSAFYISQLPKELKPNFITKIFKERPLDKVLDFLFENDRQNLEVFLIIPYFEEIKDKIEFGSKGWEWKYISLLYNTVIINNKNEEKVSFLNNSNNEYNVMNLITRLYFQNEWSYGSTKSEELTNEIYASLSSYSRSGPINNVTISIDQYVDKNIKQDILQLSNIKIKQFIEANKIIEKIKTKYSVKERTLTDLLLNTNLNSSKYS